MNSDWLRSAIWPNKLFPFGVCRPDADPSDDLRKALDLSPHSSR